MHTRRYESDPCTWVWFFLRASVWAHRWTTILIEVGSMIIRGIGQRRQSTAAIYTFAFICIVKEGIGQVKFAISLTFTFFSNDSTRSSENIGENNKEENMQLSSTAALITEEMFLFNARKHSEEKFTTLMQ